MLHPIHVRCTQKKSKRTIIKKCIMKRIYPPYVEVNSKGKISNIKKKSIFSVLVGIMIFTKLVVTYGNYFKMIIMRRFRELSVVTPVLKVSRMFNTYVITDTGYINHTMRKYNISRDLESSPVIYYITYA